MKFTAQLFPILFLLAAAAPLTAQTPQKVPASKADGAAEVSALDAMLPRLQFEAAELGECISYLNAKAAELSPKAPPLNLSLNLGGAKEPTVTLDLKQVTIREALKHICDLTGFAMREEGRIAVLSPKPSAAAATPADEMRDLEARIAAIAKDIEHEESGEGAAANAAIVALKQVQQELLLTYYRKKYRVQPEPMRVVEDRRRVVLPTPGNAAGGNRPDAAPAGR